MQHDPLMQFQLPNGGVMQVGAPAQEHLLDRRQTESGDSETGGILLGRFVAGSKDIIIDQATDPSDSDRRSRFFFYRARRPAQVKVDQAWESSNGTLNYLGEWHTHPEDDPTPSCIDRRNWRRVARRSSYEQSMLLFVIVGRTHTRAWAMGRNDNAPIELRPL